jgi:hypothetical protein
MTPRYLILPLTRSAWNTPNFEHVFKQEISRLDPGLLPLQQGLAYSSSVADEPFTVMVLTTSVTDTTLCVKAGILYAGITGGCACTGDFSFLSSQPEYCELWFEIDRRCDEVNVVLFKEDVEVLVVENEPG